MRVVGERLYCAELRSALVTHTEGDSQSDPMEYKYYDSLKNFPA
jgi:hypothetical protein